MRPSTVGSHYPSATLLSIQETLGPTGQGTNAPFDGFDAFLRSIDPSTQARDPGPEYSVVPTGPTRRQYFSSELGKLSTCLSAALTICGRSSSQRDQRIPTDPSEVNTMGTDSGSSGASQVPQITGLLTKALDISEQLQRELGSTPTANSRNTRETQTRRPLG